MIKLVIGIFNLIFAFSTIIAQEDEIVFKEGVYINFAQVLKNSPLERSRIVSQVNYEDPQFFENVLSSPILYFYDENGMKQSVDVKKIWGYSKNGDIYVGINDQFCKISYLGNICHFIVPNYKMEYETVYDPYYYNNSYYGARTRVSNPRSELRQFIIDFYSGKIFDFTVDNVSALLAKDPTLYDEYASLKKKKKEQLKFFYIRKYNQHNPLKIPAP